MSAKELGSPQVRGLGYSVAALRVPTQPGVAAFIRASAALVLVACSGTASGPADGSPDAIGGVDELQIGFIEFYGDSEGVLDVPEPIASGVAFSVTVTTYGGGCLSADSLDIAIDGDVAVLTPWDRWFQPAGTACSAELLRLPRQGEVTFATAGGKTLRVRGQRVMFGLEPVVIEQDTPIVVE